MREALIKLTKRQIIDYTINQQPFQNIFNDSHHELAVHMRGLNRNFTTWQQVLNLPPQSVNGIRNLVRPAVQYSVNALNGIIPGMSNTFSRIDIPIANWELDIIQSDVANIAQHKICMYYQTDVLTLIDRIGDKLLLAHGDRISDLNSNVNLQTFMIQVNSDIEITAYQK